MKHVTCQSLENAEVSIIRASPRRSDALKCCQTGSGVVLLEVAAAICTSTASWNGKFTRRSGGFTVSQPHLSLESGDGQQLCLDCGVLQRLKTIPFTKLTNVTFCDMSSCTFAHYPCAQLLLVLTFATLLHTDGRPVPSSSYWERLLSQLPKYGSVFAHCQPMSVHLSLETTARPDSGTSPPLQQQQQQTVQEPVLVLTTSHLLVLEHSHLLMCAISLQGV